jgi:hypothetical protein
MMISIERQNLPRRVLFAASIALVIAATARAQTVTGSVDLTAANTHYGDTFSGNSFAVSPNLHVDAPQAVFDAGGSYATLAGSWSAQANAGGSLFTPRVFSLMGEIAGYGGGSANGDGTHTGSFSGMARAHLLNDRAGVWIGAGGGRVYDGTLWRNLIQGEAGAWASIPHGTLTAVVTPSKLGDTITYTDAQGTLSVFHERIGVDVSAGFRTGSSLPIVGGDTKSWGSVSGAFWVTSNIAIIAGAGTYPVNFGQGFPGGRFVSAGIRIGKMPGSWDRSDVALQQSMGASPVPTVTPVDEVVSVPANPVLQVSSDEAGQTVLIVSAPNATLIEIAGDFTNWEPLALSKRSGGSWGTTLLLKPGIYETNIRIDGGPWFSPSGIPSKSDEFGQSVGLLVIRGR